MDRVTSGVDGESGRGDISFSDVLARVGLQIESMIDETDELVRQLEEVDANPSYTAEGEARARELAERLVPAAIYRLARCGEAASSYIDST